MGVLGQNGGDSLGLGDGGHFCLGSYYVSGQNGVGKPPHHSSGLGKFSLGSGPGHGLFVEQDLSEGEGTRGLGWCLFGELAFGRTKRPSLCLSPPYLLPRSLPFPSLPRTVGLDTGGHAGEARVHVQGQGPLAADLLVGFWKEEKEGETEGRGYQGRVGRRGEKEEKK